jgi:hypothetical protein
VQLATKPARPLDIDPQQIIALAVPTSSSAKAQELGDLLARRVEQDTLQRDESGRERATSSIHSQTIEAAAVRSSPFVNVDDHAGGRERARLLLNTPDGGSVGYRFGTLPILVGGELYELNLALFYQREPVPDVPRSRRVVMNLKTNTLGEVAITAQALGTQLQIRIESTSPDAVRQLRQETPLIETLAQRLGWHVTTVDYETCVPVAGAAARVMTHVLESDAFDHLV